MSTNEDLLVSEFVARMDRAGDGAAARDAYRDGFERIRSALDLYPAPGRPASVIFESAAKTARSVAAGCLPLGLAIAMHLYPLCVLQCIPLPWLSVARVQRGRLVRAIRSRSLVLANAGSDRTREPHHSLVARQDAEGIRIDGTCEYMSLASVADIVFFKAPLANSRRAVLCAADLRADSVLIGDWKFSGTMRLSDTSSVTFAGHLVPRGRYVLVADDDVLRCTADYQRCWFHLFVAEVYLARLERLHQTGKLPRFADQIVSLNELSRLREYALRLLDDFSAGSDVEPLKKTTSAMKLRVSLLAQSAMGLLCGPEASELRFIKSQPTSDEIILRSIGAMPVPALT